MSQPSLTDFTPPFDPSGYTSLSGPQILQYLSGAAPLTADKGIVVHSTDIAGIPQVPDANTNTKWKKYIWARQLVNSVLLYAWADGAGNGTDPTTGTNILQWTSLNIQGLGAGVITGAMIADNTIPSIKIASLDYSKLTGAPSGLTPSGAAGGDLAGTYPNPTIAANAVTSAKIAAATIAGSNVALKTIESTNLKSDAVARDMLRVKTADTTVVEWFTPPLLLDISEATILANKQMPVTINAAGTGYAYKAHDILQVMMFESFAGVSTTKTMATTGVAPLLGTNQEKYTGLGAAGDVVFTPLSAASYFIIEVNLQVSCNAAANVSSVLFSGATPLAGGLTYLSTSCGNITYKHKMASVSLAAITFAVGFSANNASTTQVGEQGGVAFFGGIGSSSITITEYL